MLKLIQRFVTNNACYKKGTPMKPKGIMIHTTGAVNPYLHRYVDGGAPLGVNKYGNHWDTLHPDGKEVCVHAFIGKAENNQVMIAQTLPWEMRGWHAGGSANIDNIGIEICESETNEVDYFKQVWQQLVALCVFLKREYRFTSSAIIGHSEGYHTGVASNHSDPEPFFKVFGKTMSDLRQEVWEMDRVEDQPNVWRVRLSANDKESQVGAYNSKELAIQELSKFNPYHIYDKYGKEVK